MSFLVVFSSHRYGVPDELRVLLIKSLSLVPQGIQADPPLGKKSHLSISAKGLARSVPATVNDPPA